MSVKNDLGSVADSGPHDLAQKWFWPAFLVGIRIYTHTGSGSTLNLDPVVPGIPYFDPENVTKVLNKKLLNVKWYLYVFHQGEITNWLKIIHYFSQRQCFWSELVITGIWIWILNLDFLLADLDPDPLCNKEKHKKANFWVKFNMNYFISTTILQYRCLLTSDCSTFLFVIIFLIFWGFFCLGSDPHPPCWSEFGSKGSPIMRIRAETNPKHCTKMIIYFPFSMRV